MSNEWYTPKYIFDALRLIFDLDVSAPVEGPRHVPCVQYLTVVHNGLLFPWHGTVWMNPPYGDMKQKRLWLRKFFNHGNGVALMPDRTSAPWFQEYAPLADAICFMSPKVKFELPNGGFGKSPANGTVLFASGEIAVAALKRCNLGILR